MESFMPRKFSPITLLFFFFFCSVAFAEAAPAEAIVWHKNYAEASEIARATGKPMMIDFTAEWCPPCKEMERSFWPRPKVIALSEKFVCVSLNYDLKGPAVSRYGVDRIPALVFTDSWGNVLLSKFGFGNNTYYQLMELMEAVPANFSAISEWNAVLERDKENASALVKVADFYRRNNVPDISNSYFKRALKTAEIGANAVSRENIMIAVGLNYLKQANYGEARKTFESVLKEFPAGTKGDMAMLGIITTHLNKKKFAEAEKMFEQMKSAYPNSPSVREAEQQMQMARSQKK